LLVSASCKKYELDSSQPHLLTVNKRLQRVWTLEEVWQTNPQAVIVPSITTTREFKKGGEHLANGSSSGTWELLDDKSVLRINLGSNYSPIDFTILKLSKHELWIKGSPQGTQQEFHYSSD
jgi:hypothetical protein